VIRNAGRPLTTCLVTLCVALTVVFAQAAAATVVNGVQHNVAGAEGHGHLAFSAIALDDHHHGGRDGRSADLANEGASDRDVGPGHHHHSDSPTANLAYASEVTAAFSDADERQLSGPDDRVRTFGSPGPERPPKPITSRV